MADVLKVRPCTARRGLGRRKIPVQLAASTALLLLLCSCGSGDAGSTVLHQGAGAVPVQAASPEQRLSTKVIDSRGGITLSPPPSSARAIDVSIARGNLEKVTGPLPASFSPKLVTFSDSQRLETDARGISVRQYADRLAWAFIEQGAYSQSAGHLGSYSGSDNAYVPIIPDGTVCTGAWLVDAVTGMYLEGYSSC